MKLFIQILFIFLTWFTSQVNAMPVYAKVELSNYEFTFSKTEDVKEESIVKIRIQNFAKSCIVGKKQFANNFNEGMWASATVKNKENKRCIAHFLRTCELRLVAAENKT